jgi:hypothetical protein
MPCGPKSTFLSFLPQRREALGACRMAISKLKFKISDAVSPSG